MPRGDYRKREAKKPKKDKRKTAPPLTSLIAPAPEPERVRRERKPREEEER